MKVHDLAKEVGKTPKDFIRFLSEVNIRVKSPNTKLDPGTVQTIRSLFEGEKKEEKEAEVRDITLSDSVRTIGQLAQDLGVGVTDIMKAVLQMGKLVNINSEVEGSVAKEIGEALNINVTLESTSEGAGDSIKDQLNKIEEDELEDIDQLTVRPPVIAVMGHVDHGKTLLIDTLRKTNVVDKEAGGITQHIGAYQIEVNGKKITVLDTPGHAAFTALRARGAQVTDIAILVVAGDEGIKPQTVEAIDHAKAAGVPIIVAVNKMDKPDANIEQVKQGLSQHDLVAEDWGGKTIVVPVSAKTGKGMDDLIEMIQLTAEMLELKANVDRAAKGIVIESKLSKQRGAVATILVKSGTLKVGDHFVIGSVAGKIRALLNDRGESVDSAPPGMPVEILGISDVPRPGEVLEVQISERDVRLLADERGEAEKQAKFGARAVSLDSLAKDIESGQTVQVNVVVKADVHGSLEAVVSSIQNLASETVDIQIVHGATGPVTENDINLAKASSAIVIAFGVGIAAGCEQIAEAEGVQVRHYTIIYEILDDLDKLISGMFKTEMEEYECGRCEVRQLFKFSKVGVIAGSYVTEGKLLRDLKAQVLREGNVVYEGKIESLKRFKDDAKEVTQGYECGVVLEGFTEVQEGDIIICIGEREKGSA